MCFDDPVALADLEGRIIGLVDFNETRDPGLDGDEDNLNESDVEFGRIGSGREEESAWAPEPALVEGDSLALHVWAV